VIVVWNKKKGPRCFKCKGWGYLKRDCPQLKNDGGSVSVVIANKKDDSDSDGDLLTVSSEKSCEAWLLVSASTTRNLLIYDGFFVTDLETVTKYAPALAIHVHPDGYPTQAQYLFAYINQAQNPNPTTPATSLGHSPPPLH